MDNVFKLDGPCFKLLTAENTWHLYGLPKPKNRREENDKRAREYRLLIESGWNISQIAKHWGWSNSRASAFTHRYRSRVDPSLPFAYRGVVTAAAKAAATGGKSSSPTVRNTHGGGKLGIKGCKCQLCVERRRLTKRLQHKERNSGDNKQQNMPS